MKYIRNKKIVKLPFQEVANTSIKLVNNKEYQESK